MITCFKTPLFRCFALSLLASQALAQSENAQQEQLDQLIEDQNRFLEMQSLLYSSFANSQYDEIMDKVSELNDPALEAFYDLTDNTISPETVLAENEVIERLIKIAEELAESGGGGSGEAQQQNQSAQAMLNMMYDMAGIPRPQQQQQASQGQQTGQTGESEEGAQSDHSQAEAGGGSALDQEDTQDENNVRVIPSSTGTLPTQLPSEQSEQLEEYYRNLETSR